MVQEVHGLGVGHAPHPIQRPGGPATPAKTPATGEQPFQRVLDAEIQRQDLRFSNHAQERLQLRQIPMGPHEMERLKTGVAQAAGKGGRESLIFIDNADFLVNVPNRTVITAFGSDSMKNNVITNIDSAVIV